MSTAKLSALKRLVKYKTEHFDGIVFWAKESFDQQPHNAFVQDRFNKLYNNYNDRMEYFHNKIYNTIVTKKAAQVGEYIDTFFQGIQRVVNAILDIVAWYGQ